MRLKWQFKYFTEERKAYLINKKMAILYLAGSLALLALLFINLSAYFRIENSHREWNTAHLEKGAKNNAAIGTVRLDFERINGLMDRKNFAWSRFLSRLEGSTPGKISISTINPSFTNGSVGIDGTALTIDDLVKFMKSLQGSKYFSDVFLSEQKNAASGSVAFVISFKYLGSVKQEMKEMKEIGD